MLFGYTKLTEYAAEAKKNGIENYLDQAVLRCIKEGFLTDYLKKNSTEVRNMLIAEYSYEDDMKVQWNVGYDAGIQEGITQGISRGISQGLQQGIQKGISQGIAQQKAEDEKTISHQADEIARLLAENEKLKQQISR